MKRSSIIMLLAALVMVAVWSSCKKSEKDVQAPLPDAETITTVQLKAVNVADSTDTVSAKWVQLVPSNPLSVDTSQAHLRLKKNANYTVNVYFLDETKTPADDITTEVRERANYHLVCFTPASGLNLTVNATDHDTHTPALPVGLINLATTAGASAGNLNVTLHHQPDLKTGDCSLGSADANVNFSVTIY